MQAKVSYLFWSLGELQSNPWVFPAYAELGGNERDHAANCGWLSPVLGLEQFSKRSRVPQVWRLPIRLNS